MSFIIIILIIVGVLYMCYDINYYIRMVLTVALAKTFHMKWDINDTTTIYGICSTQDIGSVLRHMNNARYIRELDFARFDFYTKTGLLNILYNFDKYIYQTACCIRYRREIPMFSLYKITTKCVYWDENSIYLEQKFISPKDGFVRTIALSKQTVKGLNIEEIMSKLLKKDLSYRPETSNDWKLWLSSLGASSNRLRNGD